MRIKPWAVGEVRHSLITEKLICSCGHLDNHLQVTNTGIHLKACCVKCGRYIKFIGKHEFPGVQFDYGVMPDDSGQDSLFGDGS